MGMESYILNTYGASAQEAIIEGEHYRISVLTPALIRMEYSENETFEDHPTQTVLNRVFPVPKFQVEESEDGLALSDGDRVQRCYKLLERAQMKYDVKSKAMETIQMMGKEAMDSLEAMGLGEAVLGEISEMLLA